MSDKNRIKSPSRKVIEEAVRRILMTEVLQEGKNKHFKTAHDFMPYFESLYPASDALTKQVQRAIHAMDMPKDENGYFIVDKTKAQMNEDRELSRLLVKTDARVSDSLSPETLFLEVKSQYKPYLLQLIKESQTLSGKYITIIDSTDGLIFLTNNRSVLASQIQNLERLSNYEN